MNFRITRLHAIAEARERCANPWCRVHANDVHHIIHRHEGGTDDLSNVILLCQNCHTLYHCGVVGRRTVVAWKHAITSGQTRALGLYLENWPSLPITLRNRIRSAFRHGDLSGLVAICSGIFWSTDDPENVVLYGFPLANAFRQRGRYPECICVARHLEHAIYTLTSTRGEDFGLGMRARLEILWGRIQRGIGEFQQALSHFNRAISIALSDQYAGWQEDTLLARVDQISVRTRLIGTASDELKEIGRLRNEIRDARERHLIRSPVRVAAFFGDLAVAESRFAVQYHDAASVQRIMGPAVETLRVARYTRGYSLRLLNLGDMLRTLLPNRQRKRDQLIEEIRLCFEYAAKAATRNGRIALGNSVIGGSADHVRTILSTFREHRRKDIEMERFL
jgi:tetratricopeptide (TPR) repeat protein